MPVLLSVMIAFERQMDFEPGAFDQLKGISGTAVLPDDGLYTKIPKTEWPKKYTKTGELKYSKATFQWSSIVVLTFPNTKLFVIIFIFKWKKIQIFLFKKKYILSEYIHRRNKSFIKKRRFVRCQKRI